MIVLICYALLFIRFIFLMRGNEMQYGMLWKQVLGFFSIILTFLIVNFVCDMVFYIEFDSNDNQETAVNQDKLVSTVIYIHCVMDILFNIVLLVFLISQASDSG